MWWSSGAEGEEKARCCRTARVSVGEDENVLEMDGGMVAQQREMVNFMLHVFYHHKKKKI